MPTKVPQPIVDLLAEHGQSHLCAWWNDLSDAQRDQLVRQIQQIDFDQVAHLVGKLVTGDHTVAAAAAHPEPPASVERLPKSEDDHARWNEAKARGLDLLAGGKVAAMVVAGGQGSRLGFDHPKGMFPIGPVSDRTLFQLYFEQLDALAEKVGHAIPYFIMTSEATDKPTKDFLDDQEFFGYSPHDVYIFQQGWLPAVDEDGRILLADKGTIATSPDGHGGMLRALHRSGLLEVMGDRGIESIYYHQVDNPTAILCDPVFLGLHKRHQSQLSTKVVAKVDAAEKMGVVVDVDGVTQIIEYCDLPDEQASRTGADGGLLLWAGNTAAHCFERSFLDDLTADGAPGLPYHKAHKKVAHLDLETGRVVEPSEPNAFKFEQFIFDAMPEAKVALVVESDRALEFNPVKNAEGSDSPQTARKALANIARNWVEQSGGHVAEEAVVEISPRFAIDQETFAATPEASDHFEKDTVLEAPQAAET